jgi:FecR protein
MKRKILSCLTAIVMCLSFAAFVFAQDDNRVASAAGDMYVISAKAGGVNYVEGKIVVARSNSRSGYLVKGDRLEVGEKVSTGASGKAEILLNPGSYVRLGENTVFEFVSTSLDDVKIKLSGGSAIFEVFADNEFRVAIATPKANFYAIKSGVYRVDVLQDGSGRISVWKGKAQIGEDTQAVVKGGKAAVVKNDQVAVEKFDRDDKDSLETWSKDRAKQLAKINAKLERNNVRNSLLNSFNNRGWGLYDSFGLWVFDRFSGYYCFLPFGYGWSSPYGYGYNRDLWYFRMPRYIYYQPYPANTQPSNNGNTTPSDVSTRRTYVKTPPFERVQPSVDRRSTIKIDDSDFPSMMPSAPTRTITPDVSMPRRSTKGQPDNQ